ncbi:hypothetical protein ACNSTU_07210 [Aquisalimonas sp. APHAB1-3]|uniref:hypothetical protein n=1 Tax=Aquisalimonas sp. APHAB1-3 TaxID=3402080 RepID=UPI003AADB92A
MSIYAQTDSCSIVSRITATNPDRLSKQFVLQNGELIKYPAGSLVRGHYERLSVSGPRALAEVLQSLRPNQALCFGAASAETATIASRNATRDGDINRTRDCFHWPSGPGWLLLDYDPPEGTEPLNVADLHTELCEACPALEQAPALMGSSGSAHIYNGDTGEGLKGAGGLRDYVLVADARDIPRAGQVLFDRLWLAGFGYFTVSKSGALLPRSRVDACVWQPERLDFAAGASCVPPLEQRRPEPVVLNPDASPLDTATALPDLTATERERLEEIQAGAREAVAAAQQTAREAWINERLKAKGIDSHNTEARERLHQAVSNGQLFGEFELIHESGDRVTVGDLLDKPERWHGKRFADPLEPDYSNGDQRICVANLLSGRKPYLYSHAHGGQSFRLVRASARLTVAGGQMPDLARESDRLMRLAGEVYQRGGQLVRIIDRGTILRVAGPWLRTHLESIIRWEKWDARSASHVPIDAPKELDSRVLHNRGDWTVPELTGIVRGPILRPDGSLLDQPGFDSDTGLLLLADHPDGWPPVPVEPTAAQVRRAVQTLWEPFAEFRFVDELSRAIQLAAALTAVQRPMLETAPGFGWNAYKAGSGKGKAAKTVAWLGGVEPIESPWSTNAEEQRKRLMASLMEGPPGILLDNVSEPMDSDTLCAILTSSRYKDRRLGVSEEISAPTRVLITATGNNLRLVGDLSRRLLVSTIDQGVESPERQPFPFDPVSLVAGRWLGYRAAALTILRGFIAAGSPHRGEGQMGSYEEWDALIRQCVVWLRDEELTPFTLADPADAISRNYEADPETQKLRALLTAWHSRFGSRAVRVAELVGDATADPVGQPAPERAALEDALQEIAGQPERICRRRLGRWIERNAGRVLVGMRIQDAGSRAGTRQWRIESFD